ncbi:hypothetical protein [Ureaplasma urealyticum]|uniref:Uncharacterized protein n=2 Tax=Ureaplasma urealyticum TaxID=2130 RepID=A0AAP9ABX8_UREUR|nr:hypothetical protein [Ureaplasma urealyticum]EEH01331.1 conserved hypothetical protein [Ureaplasma urealyticum serovar 8 str. ATCC 27618]EEH02396.1 conserved hypothetical protein [Ureaplasma urealyticum serovar 2 str. ATCC 27814]MCF1348970.1 hypothetical protein [Ureaplasma urealyticum]MDU3864775.1 hypothetical protein [Ureaplasma urealyticum]QDI63666.1 hypothetical protein EPH05_01485 [Ureaplasma urealyticum]
MKQRLINYIIVLIGILCIVSLVVGFAVWFSPNKNFYSLTSVNTTGLDGLSAKKIYNPNDGIFLEQLQGFSKHNIAGYVVPIIFAILSFGLLFLYYYLNKKSRAKADFPISEKFYYHTSITTLYLVGSLIVVSWILSYIAIGINFRPNNFSVTLNDNDYASLSSEPFLTYWKELKQSFDAKKSVYIAFLVITIAFAVSIIGFVNYFSLKIALEQTQKATLAVQKQEEEQKNQLSNGTYFDQDLNLLNDYDKLVLYQKNNLSSAIFLAINDQEQILMQQDQVVISSLSIEQKVKYREQATRIVFEKQDSHHDDHLATSGNF